MKKNFIMLGALALFAGLASASTLTEVCNGAEGANGATSFSATLETCPQITTVQLAGGTLASVTITLTDSFDQGESATNSFDFIYTNVDGDIGGVGSGTAPNTCLTGVNGSGSGCTDTVTGSIVAGSSYQLGNAITTDLGAYQGSSTFNLADVAAQIDSAYPGSELFGSGQLGSTPEVTFTITPAVSQVPEPGSMMLVSAGLFAVGLIGRKKLVRK